MRYGNSSGVIHFKGSFDFIKEAHAGTITKERLKFIGNDRVKLKFLFTTGIPATLLSFFGADSLNNEGHF